MLKHSRGRLRYSQILDDVCVRTSQPRLIVQMIIEHYQSRIAEDVARGHDVVAQGWGRYQLVTPETHPPKVRRRSKRWLRPFSIAFVPTRRLEDYLRDCRMPKRKTD